MFFKLDKVLNSNEEKKWTAFYKILQENNCIAENYLRFTANRDINEAIKDVNEMNLNEIYIWLTWILRGERLSKGLFEAKINDGTLIKLINRGKQLTMSGN